MGVRGPRASSTKNAAGLVLMGNLLSNAKGDDAAAERYYARAVGLPFDDAYAIALQMQGKGTGGK